MQWPYNYQAHCIICSRNLFWSSGWCGWWGDSSLSNDKVPQVRVQQSMACQHNTGVFFISQPPGQRTSNVIFARKTGVILKCIQDWLLNWNQAACKVMLYFLPLWTQVAMFSFISTQLLRQEHMRISSSHSARMQIATPFLVVSVCCSDFTQFSLALELSLLLYACLISRGESIRACNLVYHSHIQVALDLYELYKAHSSVMIK